MDKKTATLVILFFFSALTLCAAEVKPAPGKAGSGPPALSDTGYLAQEIKNVEHPVLPQAPGTVSTVINLLVSLLFVIGVIYLVMIALKFFYVRAAIPLKSQGILRVIAKEYIDTKKIIYVVEMADRLLVLGSGGDDIRTLSEITDKETIEKVKLQADEYIAKYRLKTETKFSEELKSSYLKQGKKLVDAGNQAVKNLMDKFGKKQ
jgi:flagellar biogenesis protein FliO